MMKKTLISILQKIHKIVTKHFFFSDSRIEEEEKEEVQNSLQNCCLGSNMT